MDRLKEAHDGVVMKVGVRRLPRPNLFQSLNEGGKGVLPPRFLSAGAGAAARFRRSARGFHVRVSFAVSF